MEVTKLFVLQMHLMSVDPQLPVLAKLVVVQSFCHGGKLELREHETVELTEHAGRSVMLRPKTEAAKDAASVRVIARKDFIAPKTMREADVRLSRKERCFVGNRPDINERRRRLHFSDSQGEAAVLIRWFRVVSRLCLALELRLAPSRRGRPVSIHDPADCPAA